MNGSIVNPNICDGGAIEIVGVRSPPQPTITMDSIRRLAVNGLIVNPNICHGGAIEIVGVRSSPQPTKFVLRGDKGKADGAFALSLRYRMMGWSDPAEVGRGGV